MTRCITLPVAAVSPGYAAPWTDRSADWPGFRRLLAAAWRESTQAANWLTTAFAAADASRRGVKDAPPIDCKPIHRDARRLFPSLDSQSLYAVSRRAMKAYRAERRDVASGEQTLRNHRYPYPLPVPEKDSKVTVGAGGAVSMNLRLQRPATKEERAARPKAASVSVPLTLHLEHGPDFAWQEAALARVAAGELSRGMASVRLGRRGDVLVGVPVDVPVEGTPGGNVLLVCTDPEALLVAEVEGRRRRRPLVLNEDWLRERIRSHAAWRQRFSEDIRHEVRRDRQTRRNHRRALASRCDGMNARVDDRLHKATRSVADLARRAGCGAVLYDDRCRAWVEPFPWHRMRELLRQKLEGHGITMACREGEGPGVPAPAAGQE